MKGLLNTDATADFVHLERGSMTHGVDLHTLTDNFLRRKFDFTSLYVRPNSVAEVSPTCEQVVDILRTEQSQLLRGLFDTGTEEEFLWERGSISGSYFSLSEAIRNALRPRLRRDEWRVVAKQSIASVSKEFEDLGPIRIGQEATDSVLFALGTLGRTPKLLVKLAEYTNSHASDQYNALSYGFRHHALICELHLHMAFLMLRDEDVHIRPFVLQHALKGVGSAVALYGSVREAALLFLSSDNDSTGERLTLDDEDRELLESSARDAEHTIGLD